ncbi:protocadherin gamma-B4-like [Hyperolius riggenbachi]|uniref:protocadherin gamma-B4-like n=1 Tax=Hyperolius riggenbachi TaxID=752182 RepID=UPI0035A2BFD2
MMKWQVQFFCCCLLSVTASNQFYYSILEEMKQNSIVGNVAEDLGLNANELKMRKLRILSNANRDYFNISTENGNLYVTDRIDREEMCKSEQACFLDLEILAENPVNVYSVKIEIQDINDNPPSFFKDTFYLRISESASPGSRFVLGNARDPDLGSNSLQSYILSPNPYFTLAVKTDSGIEFPELVLEQPLDRETQQKYTFVLTAFDGGKPVKSGTAIIKIFVQDINDNYPVFSQKSYNVVLNENVPVNFLVLQLNASDNDEGSNAEITYSFSHIAEDARKVFSMDSQTGVVKTIGQLDFETMQSYEMAVEAIDGGGLVAQCTVFIQIVDVNDNAPEIILTSLYTPVSEDVPLGTLVALINVKDLDSGKNGEVTCHISSILVFKLLPSSNNYYRLVTVSLLDREINSTYNITIIAEDEGIPYSMVTRKNLYLTVSDVNDNMPVFDKPSYIYFIQEHNSAGTPLLSVHASDLDNSDNARIFYSIINTEVDSIPVSSYISINSMTGALYAQRSFDYEQLREFHFQVMAKDSGSPPLSSNVTVRICITDKNDNAPKLLYPSPDTDGTAMFEFIPHSAKKGYLVTKVIAVDADAGHNAWLSYYFVQVPDPTLFVIDQQTGEIRTGRDLQETDNLRQKVVVLVKDNGSPSLSSTVSLNLVVAESFQEVLPEIRRHPSNSQYTSSNATFYLVVAIGLISFLFIATVLITAVYKCKKMNSPASLGTLGRNVYPQFTLGCPSEISDTSLPFPFSYDVCVTLDSKQNEIAYLKPVQNVPTGNLIDTGDSAVALQVR